MKLKKKIFLSAEYLYQIIGLHLSSNLKFESNLYHSIEMNIDVVHIH